MEEEKKNGCYIPMTIERQLKRYATCENHTERHEVLWHEWNHNKRWLTQVQQLILPSFPSYSLHDATHSESILHNIEMLLGEENIMQLSATDCFMILHTVYIHDIGMCLTYEDRTNFLKERKFQEYLENILNTGSPEMKEFARRLLEQCISLEGVEKDKQKEHILQRKLDIYYAVIYLMADYRRAQHGEVSRDRLIDWIDNPRKLGIGFSTIEIPNRLFYTIANCAATHTDWDFEAVLKLHQEDTGFAHDYVHPRFVAVLLQLGDALDMDNNRFHPLANELLGEFPSASRIHYGKHKAIRRLRITNQKISIGADCESQEVLRQVRRECDGIRDILEKATYYWAVIKPKDMNVGLPVLDKTELLLNGDKIPENLVQMKFEISQDKAFHLLQGNNIYMDEKVVFLRELIQNAVDATKLQYFHDCRRCARHGQYVGRRMSPAEAAEIMDPNSYPIEIDFIMAKQRDGKWQRLFEEDLKEPSKRLKEYDCGVVIKIRDYGTGIGESDVIQIADVGTSYERRKEEIERMPRWLQPTGTFGIGLQSTFLVTDILRTDTLTRKEESFRIEFNPRKNHEKGYINVIPDPEKRMVEWNAQEQLDKETEKNEEDNALKPYGTCFELFVSCENKKLHEESQETWDGKDPFQEKYEDTRKIRHTRELIKQLAYYLSDMVGEPLFPISLRIEDPYEALLDEEEKDKDPYKEMLNYYGFFDKFRDAEMAVYINGRQIEFMDERPRISWAYNQNKKVTRMEREGNDSYYFDLKKMKLNVWNHEYNAYGCFGISRILGMKESLNREEDDEERNGSKIFYKGIKVSDRYFKEDANLLEHIDLKQTLDNNYLKLNRNGFSYEGELYLEKVYHAILGTVKKALENIEEKKRNALNEPGRSEDTLIDLIEKGFLQSIHSVSEENSQIPDEITPEKIEEVREQILSITALAFWAMVHEKDGKFMDCAPGSGSEEPDENAWNELIKRIIKLRNSDDYQEREVMNMVWKNSTLFHLPIWELDAGSVSQNEGSILEIIDSDEKYAIMSIREETSNFWHGYVIHIEPKLHKKMKKIIAKLHISRNMEERKGYMMELDKCVRGMMRSHYEEQDHQGGAAYTVSAVRKQMVIIRWLLKNIPTMALFSDESGNKRLNILDKEVCDTVYFDNNMRYLIVNRMLETNTKKTIERMSIVAWSGYRNLVVKEKRQSIQTITRGMLSDIGCMEMIFPLTVKNIEDMKKAIEQKVEDILKEISSVNKMAVKPLRDYLSNNLNALSVQEDGENEQVDMSLAENRFWQIIQRDLRKRILKKRTDTDSLKPDQESEFTKKLKENDCKECLEFMKSIREHGNLAEEGREGRTSSGNESGPDGKTLYNQVLENLLRAGRMWGGLQFSSEFACEMNMDRAYRRMIDFVTEHAKMGTVREEVENSYYNFVIEIDYALCAHIKSQKLQEKLAEEEFCPDFCNVINRI
ncbi:MAG: hypothetical protein Q4C91_20810 [Eubacteriales bacterium]|nr:hypothetical protein [Eubacteriales bacterium]